MLRTIGSLRAGLLALVALGAVGAGIAAAVLTRTGSGGQEPSTRVEQWATGPAGQSGPVTVIVPNYPTSPAAPVTKGAFRLLAFGYADPNKPVPEPTCSDPTANPDGSPSQRVSFDARSPADDAVIRASTIYADVGYVPTGFQYSPPTASAVCGVIRGIGWTFPGKKASEIQIVRRKERLPYDLRVPPIDGSATLEDGMVGSYPAIFLRNKPQRPGTQTVYFAVGDIVTTVNGSVADFQELIRVAESLK